MSNIGCIGWDKQVFVALQQLLWLVGPRIQYSRESIGRLPRPKPPVKRVRQEGVGDVSVTAQSTPVLTAVREILQPLEDARSESTVELYVIVERLSLGDERDEMIVRIHEKCVVVRPLEPVDAVLVGKHLGVIEHLVRGEPHVPERERDEPVFQSLSNEFVSLEDAVLYKGVLGGHVHVIHAKVFVVSEELSHEGREVAYDGHAHHDLQVISIVGLFRTGDKVGVFGLDSIEDTAVPDSEPEEGSGTSGNVRESETVDHGHLVGEVGVVLLGPPRVLGHADCQVCAHGRAGATG